MRYILERIKGVAPAEKPVGMNDIVGIGDYARAANAFRYMRPDPERAAHMRAQGYTTLALYAFPPDPVGPCKLVGSIPL